MSKKSPTFTHRLKNLLWFSWPILGIAVFWIIRSQGTGEANPMGQKLYEIYCLNCHQSEGEGLAKLIPPLSQSDYLQQNQDQLPCLIKAGMEGPVKVNGVIFNHPMPGSPDLTPQEVYNLIDYINHAWGNDVSTPGPLEIEEAWDTCDPDKPISGISPAKP